ncbi:MAG: protein kinase [Faecousia sp.]
MSEPKLISPLLDGFVMGPSMSAHPGIRSCPAMPQDSDKRYIVKIISIPASAEQLEALLLTGAYHSQESALAYFKDQAQRTIDEIGVLKKLSGLEGFLPFEDWQLVDKTEEPGFELYLLSPYRRSLEQHLNRHTMTHLNAVNLGLDLCASLAVCRRAGYLYVNLKPENIFMSEDNEFRIGDLGFVSMDSLKYTALDERYYSPYSAPECVNLFNTLNTTVDTYAAGMILYQTYNDGKLPTREKNGQIPPPQYADYEMAEIILKAIDIDPANRWKDPIAMGQAIVAYMQKNGANDVPIVPAAITVSEMSSSEAVQADVQEPAAEGSSMTEEIPEDTPKGESDAVSDGFSEFTEDDDFLEQIQFLLGDEDASEEAVEKDFSEDIPAEQETDPSEIPDSTEQVPVSEEPPADEETDEAPDTPEDAAEDSPFPPSDDPANLSFMQFLVDDETAPSEEMASGFGYEELSQETSDILAQADELLMHETPGGVVAPEPIDVPVPPPIVPEPEQPEAPATPIDADSQDNSDADLEDSAPDDDFDEYEEYDQNPPSPFPWKKMLIAALLVLFIGAMCFGGYYYYKNYYLLEIDNLEVIGNGNTISVQISSEIDDSLITVECIDSNGTKRTSGVTDGYAEFEDLNPDTLYRIYVKVDGNHKVKGEQEARYTTPKITSVISFTAVAGAEDGSATLRFKVDGQSAKSWKVVYSTEGEEEQSREFVEDTVTITGLTVGKTYTFRLVSDDAVYIVGNNTLEYTARALVMAQDVQITSCDNGKLTVQWATPEGQSVSSWTVRCYNEDLGYSETVTTSDNSAQFLIPDTTQGYTVAVTAEGMTTPSRAFLKPNSVTVHDFKTDDTDPTKLVVSWQYTGPAPEGEWLLMYSIDGNEEKAVIRTSRIDSVVVPNKVPNAAYSFTISTQSGVTVFHDTYTAQTGAAESFNNYKIAAKDMVFRMCKTPEKANWTYQDVQSFGDTFKVGEKASFTVSLRLANGTSHDQITIMYVIRDSEGKVLSNKTSTDIWSNMWYNYRGELDVPALPDKAGSYTIEIYFNGYSVHSQQFTMTQ